MLVDPKHLLDIRSQLVEEVLAYLDGLAEQAATLPSYYPLHLRTNQVQSRDREGAGKTPFDDIRQLVQVVEDRTAFERWLAEERERRRAAGYEVERLAYRPTRARPETEERDSPDFDYPAPPPPLLWDERAGERFKRAIILGDPGFGKTWLLRYEARRLARHAAQQLRERTIRPADLTLPIFARLSDLNQSDEPIEDALVALASTEGVRMPFVTSCERNWPRTAV